MKEGDHLLLSVKQGVPVIKAQRQVALDALHALHVDVREAFESEEELQEEGRKIREQLVREKYGLG